MASWRCSSLCYRSDSLQRCLTLSHLSSSVFLGTSASQVCQQKTLRSDLSSKSLFCGKQHNTTVNLVRLLHYSSSLTAGHSKWHNIKHIKAANDKARASKSNMLASKIQTVLDKHPDTNPKTNTELGNLIKWARTNNIPNDVIDRTIDRQVKLRDPKSITAFDGRGPSNTGMIIECFSLKPQHTKSLLQGIVKKFGFNLNTPAIDLFDHKGLVDVELSEEELSKAQSDPENFCIDKYIDMAIEAGAEDVTLVTDDENPYLQFICGPFDVSKVSKVLGDSGLTVINGERVYLPKIVVPVSREFLDGMTKMTDKLDLHSDVIKYHFNIEPES